MSVRLHNQVEAIEKRLGDVEQALQILLRSGSRESVKEDIDRHPTIAMLKGEIRAIKARMGKLREAA